MIPIYYIPIYDFLYIIQLLVQLLKYQSKIYSFIHYLFNTQKINQYYLSQYLRKIIPKIYLFLNINIQNQFGFTILNLTINISSQNIIIFMPLNNKIQQITISSQLKNIRSRIIKIIDQKIYLFQSTMNQKQSVSKSKKQAKAIINQSKLEEWIQFFYNQILLSQKQEQTINSKPINKYTQSQSKLDKIIFKKPHQSSIDSNKILYCKQNDDIFKVFTQTDRIQKVAHKLHDKSSKQKVSFQEQSYQLTQDSIKRNCSVDYIHKQNRIILIGGCKTNNPNIKSSKIYSFHIKSGQLELIAKLPYGISSHGTVYDQQNKQIYIIGGNKNHSVVTRGCFKFNINSNVLQQISCLNYPASSMNCILWRQMWVYKFGGIGESFQNWNTSPYIERQLKRLMKVLQSIIAGNALIIDKDIQFSKMSGK